MTKTHDLERLGFERLSDTVEDAKRGAYPGRKYRGNTFTREVGKTREDLRGDIAREREWFLLTRHRGEANDLVVTIVFPVLDGAASAITAEVFDHERGTSIVLSQPAKKGLFRWKTTGSIRTLGLAEPLHQSLAGPTVSYELGHVELEERRQLLRDLEASGIPHRTGPGTPDLAHLICATVRVGR